MTETFPFLFLIVFASNPYKLHIYRVDANRNNFYF